MHVYVCTLHSESMCLFLCLSASVYLLTVISLGLCAWEHFLRHFGEVLPSACDVTSPKPQPEGGSEGLWFRSGDGWGHSGHISQSKADLLTHCSPIIHSLWLFSLSVCVGMNAQ